MLLLSSVLQPVVRCTLAGPKRVSMSSVVVACKMVVGGTRRMITASSSSVAGSLQVPTGAFSGLYCRRYFASSSSNNASSNISSNSVSEGDKIKVVAADKEPATTATTTKPTKLTPEEVEAESEKNLERLMKENFRGDVDPNLVLYKGESEFLVRMLFGTATFNLIYWTQYLVYAAYNTDVLMNGIPVAGELKWGYLGLVGTSVMYFMNIYMSRYTIRRVYYPASGDANRIGFQMYNMLGFPGRKIETELGNTKVWRVRSDKDEHMIRIGGFGRNLLLAEKADYGGSKDMLVDLLNR